MSSNQRNVLVLGVGLIAILAYYQTHQGGNTGTDTSGKQKPSVLILMEPTKKTNYPSSMVDSWDSEEVATWMAENAEDFIVQNKDADFSDEKYTKFKEVMEKYPPDHYPWCYISNGRTGAQGDPPIDGKALIAATKKYVPQ